MKRSMPFRVLLFGALITAVGACSDGGSEVEIQSPSGAEELEQTSFMVKELLDKAGLVFLSPEGTTVERSKDGITLSSALLNVPSSGKTGGTFTRVPEDFERGAAGRMVRVTVTAKSAVEKPSSAFAVAYSTNSNGNSGWTEFQVTPAIEEFSFEYKLPNLVDPSASKLEGDFLGINADLLGRGSGIVVSSVKLEVIG